MIVVKITTFAPFMRTHLLLFVFLFVGYNAQVLAFSPLLNPVSGDSLLFKPIPIWSFTGYYGAFIKHSPRLTTRTGQKVAGGEISFSLQTRGAYAWQVAHRFPSLGVGVIWQNPGKGAHGNLVGMFPHMTLSLAQLKHFGVYFRVGTGMAYTQRPHDSFTNPNENALGSYWNNITQFRFTATGQLTPHWQVSTGVSLTHFSNGSFELPNFGMNIPSFVLSLGYHKRPIDRKKFNTIIPQKSHTRRLGGQINSNFARIEYVSLDGPKYLVWSVTGAATYLLHRYNRIAVGAEWEHNNGVETWLFNNTLLGNDRSDAHQGANRLGLFVADEFLYGPLGIYIQGSYHIGAAPLNTFTLSRNYNKLSVRYYFPLWKNAPIKTNIGIYLKAYKAVAESIGVNLGVSF
jgi:Lipid A 3-O-deacylase (PagL)